MSFGIIPLPGNQSTFTWLNSTNIPTYSPTFFTNNSQCTAITLILAAGFAANGTPIRIGVQPQYDVGTQTILNMYAGCQSNTPGDSAASFDGAEVPIFFNSGGTSITLNAGGPVQYSDPFTLTGADSSTQIDGARNILFSWDFGTAASSNSIASFVGTSTTGANFVYYYRAPKTVTFAITSPGEVTYSAHTMVAGDQLFFTTSGALPAALTANTNYFVKTVISTSKFTISATNGGAAINFADIGTGTQTGHPQNAASTLRTVNSGNFVAVAKKVALIQVVQVA